MAQHHLQHWTLSWNEQWTRTAGRTYRDQQWIKLSAPIVRLNPEPKVRELVLHEIAHALTNGGHDEAWQDMVTRIGGSADEFIVMVLPTEEEGRVIA